MQPRSSNVLLALDMTKSGVSDEALRVPCLWFADCQVAWPHVGWCRGRPVSLLLLPGTRRATLTIVLVTCPGHWGVS